MSSEKFEVSSDKLKMNTDFIHEYLSTESYWAKGRTKLEVQRTIDNSFCIAVFHSRIQVGFGRVVTDYQTYAFVMDVFVSPLFQNKGLGKLIMRAIINSDEMKHVKTFSLKTVDAGDFYKGIGFVEETLNQFVLKRQK